MDLKSLLKLISETAKQNGIREPYVVGGIPRDLFMGNTGQLNDIDLTNGEASISKLADLMAAKLQVQPKILADGHKKLRFERFTLDFSTNEIYSNADTLLNSIGITHIDDLVRETYCRDFTINTLLLPLDFNKILDLTAKGKKDISDKIIRCPLDPVITIKASPNRIIRAFYYAAKYKFKIDDELKRAISLNLDLLQHVKEKYASDKISEAISLDPKILDELVESGVMHKIRLTKDITDALVKSRKLTEVL